jgi:sterol 24-C-methyltransferase
MKVADLGCGVGGPGRSIARFSGATVVGVNNNDYQLGKCRDYALNLGPKDLLQYQKADFMNLPFEENSFDGAFHIEALVHAPDRLKNFQQVFRILKPGATFGGYDWVVTNRHDPNNPEHVRVKKAIELGNSIPDLATIPHIIDCLKGAGFEVIEYYDVAELHNPATDIPWYDALDAKWSMAGFKHTQLGRFFTTNLVWALEKARLAPKGTLDVQMLLTTVADELVKGGKLGTFTPMLFYRCRKPLNA